MKGDPSSERSDLFQQDEGNIDLIPMPPAEMTPRSRRLIPRSGNLKEFRGGKDGDGALAFFQATQLCSGCSIVEGLVGIREAGK